MRCAILLLVTATLAAEEVRPAMPADPAAEVPPAMPAEPAADEPRTGPSPSTRERRPSTSGGGATVHVGGGFRVGHIDDEAVVVVLAVIGSVAAIVIPIAVLEDGYHRARYPAHPYADGAAGATLIHDDVIGAHRAAGGRAQWWTARVQADGATTVDGPSRAGAQIAIDSAWRIGLEVNADAWADDADGWDDDGSITPRERAGEALLTWRFAHSERAQFRLGIGPAVRRTGGETRAGVALLYAAEFYPARPLVLGGEARWASVGDDQIDGRLALHAGVLIGGGLELQFGGELAHVDHHTRYGPLLGVRWWF